MPLQDGLLIAVKDGVVELTANLVEPHRDDPGGFGEALQVRLAEHQYQAMTDDSIMGDDLALASCVVCRDPVPDGLKAPLRSCGFTPQETPGGTAPSRSFFGLIGGPKQRSKLEKWSVRYLRSVEIDPSLGAFEAAMIEGLPEGAMPEVIQDGTSLAINASKAYFRLGLSPRLESLMELEQYIDRLRRQRRSRWVMHPSAVRGLTAFTIAVTLTVAPETQWSDEDDDNPLWVRAAGGRPIATDPEFRVVEFIRRGLRSALSDYVKDVVRQSENR